MMKLICWISFQIHEVTEILLKLLLLFVDEPHEKELLNTNNLQTQNSNSERNGSWGRWCIGLCKGCFLIQTIRGNRLSENACRSEPPSAEHVAR